MACPVSHIGFFNPLFCQPPSVHVELPDASGASSVNEIAAMQKEDHNVNNTDVETEDKELTKPLSLPATNDPKVINDDVCGKTSGLNVSQHSETNDNTTFEQSANEITFDMDEAERQFNAQQDAWDRKMNSLRSHVGNLKRFLDHLESPESSADDNNPTPAKKTHSGTEICM